MDFEPQTILCAYRFHAETKLSKMQLFDDDLWFFQVKFFSVFLVDVMVSKSLIAVWYFKTFYLLNFIQLARLQRFLEFYRHSHIIIGIIKSIFPCSATEQCARDNSPNLYSQSILKNKKEMASLKHYSQSANIA